MPRIEAIKHALRAQATPARATINAWFFKTKPGQYGAGDIFIGLTVPLIRSIIKKYLDLPLTEIAALLRSPEHEFRLAALLILVNQFMKADEARRRQIHTLYVQEIRWVNNWDLVDTSAEYLVGEYLVNKSKNFLLKLARSSRIWERRIAIIATFAYIKKKDPAWTLKIATILLDDTHDLIHKAVGWMLREVGKRCGQSIEEDFLRKNYRAMPRTMLRYAIEHFPPELRQWYLKK